MMNGTPLEKRPAVPSLPEEIGVRRHVELGGCEDIQFFLRISDAGKGLQFPEHLHPAG